jgi:hypothetical protein
MTFYGDVVPHEFCCSSRILTTSMSTAIGRIYTSEGFVIAADGRHRRADEKGIVTDTAQKIFPVSDSNKSLAVTFAGNVGITNDENPNLAAFDFLIETAKALESMGTILPRTLKEYVEKLCDRIEQSLREAKLQNRFQQFPTNAPSPDANGYYSIAHIFFDGYYRGVPTQVHAAFFHENQELAKTEVNKSELVAGVMIGYGSLVICDLLNSDDDGWVANYRVKPQRQGKLTLGEAELTARGYVGACSDPRALKLDEKICSAIGGYTHVATITKFGGFKWSSKPKALQSMASGLKIAD